MKDVATALTRAARPIRFEAYAERRDSQIIAMNANGCGDDEIALELSLHPATVRKVLRESGR